MSDPTPGNIPPTPVNYPVRYYPANTSYLMPNSRGEWVKASEGGVVTLLMMNGTSGTLKDSNGLTPVHLAMHKIRTELDVTFAGKLAGWPVGEHMICGQRILVTQGPSLVKSTPGQWPRIAKLIAQLFGADPEHGPTQQAIVMGWLRSAWIGLQIGLSTHSFTPGQALCVMGEPGCGKSVFQQFVTKLLGNRSADPTRYLTGRTDFNEDLMAAEHLAIEDTASARDWKSRTEFGQNIKNFLVNHTHSLHPKGGKAITVQRFCRLDVSLNKQPEDAMVLPPMTSGVSDKFVLLLAAKAELPATHDRTAIREFWADIEKELPHFADALESFELPAELVKTADDKHQLDRYGVPSWHHPAITEMLEDLNPYRQLLELIDEAKPWQETIQGEDGPVLLNREFWKGTSSDLESVLAEKQPDRARRVLRGNMSTGRDLRAIAEKHPNRVDSYQSGGRTLWRIRPTEAKPVDFGALKS